MGREKAPTTATANAPTSVLSGLPADELKKRVLGAHHMAQVTNRPGYSSVPIQLSGDPIRDQQQVAMYKSYGAEVSEPIDGVMVATISKVDREIVLGIQQMEGLNRTMALTKRDSEINALGSERTDGGKAADFGVKTEKFTAEELMAYGNKLPDATQKAAEDPYPEM